MFKPVETFCRSLAFIQMHARIVYPSELPDELLEAWIDMEPDERINRIRAARYNPMQILRETPDERMIPLKVFVYTYDRYCSENYPERGPQRWLDPQAERRYLEFQFIIQTLRYDREHGTLECFPPVNLFDYANYPSIIESMRLSGEDEGLDDDLPN